MLEPATLEALPRLLTEALPQALGIERAALLLWNRKLDNFEALTPGETHLSALRPDSASPIPESGFLLSEGTLLRTRDGSGDGVLVPLMARSGVVGMLVLAARAGGRVVLRRLPLRRFFTELADDLEKELPGISIVWALDLSEEGAGSLDEDKIRRAVGNLTSNARDVMGGRGVVHLTVRVVPARDDAPERLLVEVADEGPGVPPEIRATLFEPFVTARKKGGTGLGLAVARRFVEDHGGTIELVADPPLGGPTGARFRLVLPLVPESRPGGDDGAR